MSAQPAPRVFDGIKALEIRGPCTIAEDGEITGEHKVTRTDGDTLLIDDELATDGNRSSGGSRIVSIGSIFAGGSIIQSGGGASIVQDSTGTRITGLEPSARIIINGVSAKVADFVAYFSGARPLAAVPAKPPQPKLYIRDSNRLIARITCKDSGIVRVPAALLSRAFKVAVHGTANFVLPATTFDSLVASVVGNGDISGPGESRAYATTASLSVTGNGDISGITILDTGSATVTGNGDISVRAVHRSRVSKQCNGNGDITIGHGTAPQQLVAAEDEKKTTTKRAREEAPNDAWVTKRRAKERDKKS